TSEKNIRESKQNLTHLEQRLDPLNTQVQDKQTIYNEQYNAHSKLSSEMEARKMSKAVIDQQLSELNGKEISKQIEIRTQVRRFGAQKISLNQLQQQSTQNVNVQQSQHQRRYILHDNEYQTKAYKNENK
ncbi:unnamed protein product, partial [Rotaria socialis]